MAAEMRYNHAREQWLSSGKRARQQKQSAEKDYEEMKDLGMAENQNFETWASTNAPAFIASYQEFSAAAAAYAQAAQNFDSEAWNKWQEEYTKQRNEAYYGSGKDHGSNFLIIIPEE